MEIKTEVKMKGKVIVEHLDKEQVEFDTLEEAQESILESYTDKDEGIHPDIEAVKIYKEICKIEVPENADGTYNVNFVPLDGQVIKAAPQACAAAGEISKALTKQQLSFKEKLIISLAGNDKYVLMKEIDRDRVNGIVYKDFDYEETAKTIIKQAEKIIEIMEA